MRWLILVMCLGLAACGGDDEPAPDAMALGPDADPSAPDAGASACMGTTPLYDSCTTNEECADFCLCYTFGMGQMICTKACTMDTDCPAPSPGCNGMGICRRPQ